MYILQCYTYLERGTGAFQFKKIPCRGAENLEKPNEKGQRGLTQSGRRIALS